MVRVVTVRPTPDQQWTPPGLSCFYCSFSFFQVSLIYPGHSALRLNTLLLLCISGSNGDYLYETVAEGEDVALSCRNITSDQGRCENTDWLFGRNSRNTVLFSQGQKYEHVTSALSLSENCSLGLKSVTEEQAGEYYCQQFIGSREESTDTNFILSVVKREYFQVGASEWPQTK